MKKAESLIFVDNVRFDVSCRVCLEGVPYEKTRRERLNRSAKSAGHRVFEILV